MVGQRKPPIALTCWLRAGESRFRQFAAHRGRSVALVFLVAIVGRLALLPINSFPAPQVHDEFSYLLGADTFASGRWTNPPHPLWVFFETFHELQQPTYQSKYPPAQAAFLAIGKVLFGHPWFGVLISTALLCAATCWMLQAWVPSYIALFGGLAMVLHVGLASYWVNTYWGGSIAALGGCLVLGAMRRLLAEPTVTNGLAAAAGLALLANSRPYEGLVLLLSATAVFVLWRHTERRKTSAPLSAVRLIPAALALACAAGALLYYDFRVTGSSWDLPWQVHERQYAMAPPFRFMPLRPAPVYRNQVLHDGWAVAQVDLVHQARLHPFRQIQQDVGGVLKFFPGLSPLWIPLLVFPFALRRRDARFIALAAALFWCGMLLENALMPHYPSPGLGLALLMIAFGFRYLRLFARRTTRDGLTASRMIVVISLLVPLLPIYQYVILLRDPNYRAREDIVKSLASTKRPALILVRYSAHHDVRQEWVFNDADIDHSPVVWARDRGAEDQRLLDYFRGRDFWLFEPDSEPASFKRWTPSAAELSSLTSPSLDPKTENISSR